MNRNYSKILGLALLCLGMSSVCLAAATPEIDPASGANALALLGAALLIVRGRHRR